MFGKKKKNIEEPNVNTAAIEMNLAQLAKMTPAVTFAPPSITTLSGESVPNGGVYNRLIEVNGMCMDVAFDSLNNGADPRFVSKALDIASHNIFNSIVDSFMNAVYNHYVIYLNRVNLIILDMFDEINPPVSPLLPNEKSYSLYRGNRIYRGTRDFINYSMEMRNANFDSGAFFAFVTSAVNEMGSDFYNTALTRLTEAVSFFEGDKEFLQTKIVNDLNNITSFMMIELLHESRQFVENIHNFSARILSYDDIGKIKYMNEPEKLAFLKEKEKEYEIDF